MQVSINGETKTIESGLTIAALLEALGVSKSQVAVECNGDIVPKSRHDQTEIQEGDAIELVRFIGGG